MSFTQLELDDSVAVIWLDQEGEKLNTLSVDLLDEFSQLLGRIEGDDQIQAAVLISRKPDCFIAGADIKELMDLKTAEQAEKASLLGNRLLRRMAESPKPIVAALNGATLGGGLEVALACSYRIAGDDPKTILGQPEVRLGLLPGAGGTQRLPRLVGLQKALGILLTGKNVYPHPARKMGLVDEVIHSPGLLTAAKAAARELASGKRPLKRRALPLKDRLLEATGWGRKIIYDQARKRVRRETQGNYPAPLRIVEVVRSGLEQGLEAGLKAESKAFGELTQSPQCQELVRLFFAVTSRKKKPEKARAVTRIGVLGAGLMGAGIAQVSALKDYSVWLKDLDQDALGRGQESIWSDLQKRVDKRAMSPFERDLALSRVHPVTDYDGFDQVELVIEAVFEDLDLKRRILADTERETSERAIFASNTSALPISEIAAGAMRPQQVIGMHYFSPVPKMPLLEVVVTDNTADWVSDTAVQVGIRQGKTVIVVRDGPGFYTTRILAHLMNEALLMLEEGAEIKQLDAAMKHFGFPVGPITLIDEVGIDVGAHVSSTLSTAFRSRGLEPTKVMQKLSDDGFKGRKNGVGFYRYSDRARKKDKQVNVKVYDYFGGPGRKNFYENDIQERLSLAMINEAALCLEDEILLTPEDGDIGAVLGIGFPPFRGGPFRYIDSLGAQTVVDQLHRLESVHGTRFRPAGILEERASQKRRFHEDS